MSESARQTLPLTKRHARRQEGPELIGQLVDQRFRVLSLIGSGGMADVYEVEHVTLGRRLALKVLRHTQESNAAAVRRFLREAKALSRISSEYVVSIFDFGVLPGGFPFFIMELLRGDTLRGVLQAEQRMPVARVSNLVLDVCLGLLAAHRAGCVHRDLKPENLWLTRRDDGREACLLLDFGVARFHDARTTSDGVLVGTARYMSPEQISSDAALGPESDVFALGVIAYECLCGEAPFVADTMERTLFRVLNERPRPIAELAPEVPPTLWSAMERALRKERSERFASALEMARAFLPFAGAQRQLPLPELGVVKIGGPLDPNADTEPLAPMPVGVEPSSGSTREAARPRLNRVLLAAAFVLGLALLPLSRVALSALVPAPVSSALQAPQVAKPVNPPPIAQSAAGKGAEDPPPAPASSTRVPLAASSTSALKSLPSRRASQPTPAPVRDSAEIPSTKPELVGPPQPSFDGSNPYGRP